MMTNQVTKPPHIDDSYHSLTTAPIGLFDSGVGGLSVYMHLKERLPDERYIYYADTLNVPYGSRTPDEIQQLSIAAIDWLVSAGCKLIVIACNSASAHALKTVRQKYPHIPIVGLVPALKPAVLNTQSRHVAVLATKATLDGELLNNVIKEYAEPAKVTVSKWFNPELVPWVEAGMPLDSDTATRLKAQLTQFASDKVDYLVLGCTHYPFFRDFVTYEIKLQKLGIKVIDSGEAIAERVRSLLPQALNAMPSHCSIKPNSTKATDLDDLHPDSRSVSLSDSQYDSNFDSNIDSNFDSECHSNFDSEAECEDELSIDYAFNIDQAFNKQSHKPSKIDSQQPNSSDSDNERIDQLDATSIANHLPKPRAKLSFYVTDPKADLMQVTQLVKRLIYHDPIDSQAIDAVKNKQTV